MVDQTRRLTLQQARGLEHRLRPYLRNSSEQEMRRRLEDILRNVIAFTPEGKIGAIDVEDGGPLWRPKLSALEIEYEYRGIDPVDHGDVIKNTPFNRETLSAIRRNLKITRHMSRKGIFCKFGKACHIQNMLQKGAIRIAPASTFRGGDNNAARQDDELSFRAYISPYDYDLGLIDPFFRNISPQRGWHIIDHLKPTDHYLYCLTAIFDMRFFFDFEAEACLLIHDQEGFERRLMSVVTNRLPNWHIEFGPAQYIDPYFLVQILPNEQRQIYFCKGLRYMYQSEWRLVALPQSHLTEPLEAINVDLGYLGDIAEFIQLES